MVDLFCCAGATAGLVSEAGSEELSRVIASRREVLTRVLMAGDEIQPREWLRADSGSDSLSVRVVAGFGSFPVVRRSTPDCRLWHAARTPDDRYHSPGEGKSLKGQQLCQSLLWSFRQTRQTSVSRACGSRPLRFAVSRRLIICAARFPAISEPANNRAFRPITTGRIARSQILLSGARLRHSGKQLSSSRRFRI